MKRILVAGGTGYLGTHMIKALYEKGYEIKAIARSAEKGKKLLPYVNDLEVVDISQPDELNGIMTNIDTVISTVGITRQRDGLTYMDVDYRCNLNLLDQALSAGVKRFMYIAALQGDQLTHLEIMKAKEKFAQALNQAAIDSYIIRPSGFFNDVETIYKMARNGKVYVFGKGDYRANPIHGSDLAAFCIEKLLGQPGVFPVGGPEIYSQKELAEMSFKVLHKDPKIKHIPLKMIQMTKWFSRKLMPSQSNGPIEFFLTVLTRDMIGPKYGEITLKDHFEKLEVQDAQS